jgi:hypothetical protein
MFTVSGRFDKTLTGDSDVTVSISGGMNVLDFRLL